MKPVILLLVVILSSVMVQASVFQCIDSDSDDTYFKGKVCEDTEVFKKKIELKGNINKIPSTSLTSVNTHLLGKKLLGNTSFENNLINWRYPVGILWEKNQVVNNSGGVSVQSIIPSDDKYNHETVIFQYRRFTKGAKGTA